MFASTIINYVDLDSGPGTLDYTGGHSTYDGHNGLDMTLTGYNTSQRFDAMELSRRIKALQLFLGCNIRRMVFHVCA